jgi:iron complex outermembrane receptor protein
MGHGFFRPTALALGVTLACLGADRQKTSRDLTEVSLEDLMNIEVTIASKKHQRLSQTPAAVFVITQEDIRRSGLSAIPDLLRMVPGMQVAQTLSGDWAVSARGFNDTYSNKLLVLVDGRTVYSPMFSGVFWDEQDIPLETIERIEVIRGPGATVWGTNAVNGVINIITKSARDTQGAAAKAGIGTGGQKIGVARYGGELGRRGHYRFASKYLHGRSLRDAEQRFGIPGQSAFNLGFRADWELSARDSLMLKADGFQSRSEAELIRSRAPLDAPARGSSEASGGSVMLSWLRSNSDASHSELQVYLSRPVRSDVMHRASYTTIDFDFHNEIAVSESNAIVWGLNFRDSALSTRGTTHAYFTPESRNVRLFSGFVQNEWTIAADRLALIAGTKLEHNAFSGGEIQPTARILWTPTASHTAWGAVSRAVRAPSMLDSDLRARSDTLADPSGLPIFLRAFGNPDFLPESVIAIEAGYRLQAASRLSIDVAAHHSIYRRLRSYETGAPAFFFAPQPHVEIHTVFGNAMRGRARGFEATATWSASDRWRLIPGYSWLQLNMRTDPGSLDVSGREYVEGRNPRHQAQIRSLLDITRRLQFDAAAYYNGALSNLAIPAYTRVDARLGYRIGENFELGVAGQNLQGGWRAEFVSTGPYRRAEVGRSVMLTLSWGL